MDIEVGDNSQGGARHLNFNTTTSITHGTLSLYKEWNKPHSLCGCSMDQSFTSNADINCSQPTSLAEGGIKAAVTPGFTVQSTMFEYITGLIRRRNPVLANVVHYSDIEAARAMVAMGP